MAIGSDHRGVERRKIIAAAVEASGGESLDLGTHSTESVDYPDIAAQVANAVKDGQADFGILICGTGIGVSIAANKISGIRAAVVHDLHTAKLSRQHNNANVLCMSAEQLTEDQTAEIIDAWLNTDFEAGRHQRRVDKIQDLETAH